VRLLRPGTVVGVIWLVWWLTWWMAARWSSENVSGAGKGRQIPYRILTIAGVILFFGLYQHDFRSEVVLWDTSRTVAWVLVGVTCAGLGFTWWARIHLGRFWSANVNRKADHRVVDSGPYAIVRHPIYTGIILATMATAVMRGTVLGWLGMALLTAGWYVKARLEERFLREQLGEAYARYAKRVPMLIPFL